MALSLLAGIMATVICYRYLDAPLALMVLRASESASHSVLSLRIPDLMIPFVLSLTGLGMAVCLYLGWRGRGSTSWRLSLLLGTAVPTAFVLVNALKFVFGRTETRFWLKHLDFPHGFHWFEGDSLFWSRGSVFGNFPSGHMAVFSSIALVLMSVYPRWNPVWAGFLILMGLALVVTDYHFLSDVTAGFCVGLVSYGVSSKILKESIRARERRKAPEASRSGTVRE